MTGVSYHKDYLLHKQATGHPERPERLTAVLDYLEDKGVWESLKQIKPSPASVDDVLMVHTKEHVEGLRRASQGGGGYLNPEAYACPETFRVALLAAGGLMSASDAIIEGKIENAFALIRPPGHHAEKDRAMGFCYINNAAVCARHIQKKHGLEKILIIDWDAHAANGTEDIFYDDPSVLVVSIHQDPATLYPGKGFAGEKGAGEGVGYTVNIPVPAGSGDEEYKKIFDEKIDLKVGEFNPDFIIVSAGFDSHRDDPLANLNLTEKGYAYMSEKIMEYARNHCNGRLLVELEGGYNLNALASSIHVVVEKLLEGERK